MQSYSEQMQMEFQGQVRARDVEGVFNRATLILHLHNETFAPIELRMFGKDFFKNEEIRRDFWLTGKELRLVPNMQLLTRIGETSGVNVELFNYHRQQKEWGSFSFVSPDDRETFLHAFRAAADQVGNAEIAKDLRRRKG